MERSFKIKHGKGSILANLTLAVGPDLAGEPFSPATKRLLAESLAVEAAVHGFALQSAVLIDVQSNWLSAGADVTVAAFVAKAKVARELHHHQKTGAHPQAANGSYANCEVLK